MDIYIDPSPEKFTPNIQPFCISLRQPQDVFVHTPQCIKLIRTVPNHYNLLKFPEKWPHMYILCFQKIFLELKSERLSSTGIALLVQISNKMPFKWVRNSDFYAIQCPKRKLNHPKKVKLEYKEKTMGHRYECIKFWVCLLAINDI